MADSKKKSAPEKKVPIGPVFVPKWIRDAAKAKSAKTGISLSFVIREAVTEWIKAEPNGRGADQ